MFYFHQKKEFNDVSREPAHHAKQISFSKKLPWHEGPFWSVLLPLSTRSSKFLNEVLHAKFALQYSVKEMFR